MGTVCCKPKNHLKKTHQRIKKPMANGQQRKKQILSSATTDQNCPNSNREAIMLMSPHERQPKNFQLSNSSKSIQTNPQLLKKYIASQKNEFGNLLTFFEDIHNRLKPKPEMVSIAVQTLDGDKSQKKCVNCGFEKSENMFEYGISKIKSNKEGSLMAPVEEGIENCGTPGFMKIEESGNKKDGFVREREKSSLLKYLRHGKELSDEIESESYFEADINGAKIGKGRVRMKSGSELNANVSKHSQGSVAGNVKQSRLKHSYFCNRDNSPMNIDIDDNSNSKSMLASRELHSPICISNNFKKESSHTIKDNKTAGKRKINLKATDPKKEFQGGERTRHSGFSAITRSEIQKMINSGKLQISRNQQRNSVLFTKDTSHFLQNLKSKQNSKTPILRKEREVTLSMAANSSRDVMLERYNISTSKMFGNRKQEETLKKKRNLNNTYNPKRMRQDLELVRKFSRGNQSEMSDTSSDSEWNKKGLIQAREEEEKRLALKRVQKALFSGLNQKVTNIKKKK
jgi:hypothetical protein